MPTKPRPRVCACVTLRCWRMNEMCLTGAHMSASAGACDAFLPARINLKAADAGPLSGLTFAAKDLYDVRLTRQGRPASGLECPLCLHAYQRCDIIMRHYHVCELTQ